MANYNPPQGYPSIPNGQGQQMSLPYGNNLIMNSPYDNYMGRVAQQQIFSQNQFLKCRPVSSKDEAIAFQIDLDGSLWVFTDVGNEHIYTKQINNDGTATFKTYALTQDKSPYETSQYVTREEFNKVIQSLMAATASAQSKQNVSASSSQNNRDFNI